MNYISILLVAVVIATGGWYFLYGSNDTVPAVVNETVTETPVTPATGSTTSVVEIKVTSQSFSFNPKEIKVKKGDKVRIVLSNTNGFHDFVVDEFNARTKKLNAGESDTIEFVADKTGTFEYYCSVGTHRQMGMVGKLIVE